MKKWLAPPSLPIPAELEQGLTLHPFVYQALVQRGIKDKLNAQAYLDPRYYQPTPATDLPGLIQAVERIERAIHQQETIGIWGDFDVDGQTSTTVLVEGLHGLGAQVLYHIPVRDTESHGVNLPELEKLVSQGANLILTCDTGITAHEAADWACQHRIDFLITDHHDPPAELPQSTATINPKFLPQSHPLSTLPGVGVAYKLIEELYRRANLNERVTAFYDLAALGIIADVAELHGDARYLAQAGIEALRQTQRLGLRILLNNAEINPQMLNEEHIGFGIAPRLNAVGRLGDANPVVEFLTTQDEQFARQFAYEIESYNEQRKRLSEDVFQAALYQLENKRELLDDAVLVLYHPLWHAGVLGIVASRLVERYGKPVILLSGTAEQGARGSARSIPGIHITQAIIAQANMLSSFGGHPMAAGLAFAPDPDMEEKVARFRKAISYTVQQQNHAIEKETPLQLSGYLPLNQVDWNLARAMEQLAPFGAGNPAPVFAATNLHLLSAATVGRLGEHRIMTVEDEAEQSYQLIWWQGASWDVPQGVFDLAYHLRATSFKGETQIQLEWTDFRQQPQDTIRLPSIKRVQVFDHRSVLEPLILLEEIRSNEDEILIWAEAGEHPGVHGQDRTEFHPAKALVIWTIPPSYNELRQAVEQVSPQKIYLFAINPKMDELQSFLERLKGLIKLVIHRQSGVADWGWLMAATAQTKSVVKLGLDWLETTGWITFKEVEEEKLVIAKGEGSHPPQNEQIYHQLCQQLAESAAYRRFYHESSLEALQEQLRR